MIGHWAFEVSKHEINFVFYLVLLKKEEKNVFLWILGSLAVDWIVYVGPPRARLNTIFSLIEIFGSWKTLIIW